MALSICQTNADTGCAAVSVRLLVAFLDFAATILKPDFNLQSHEQ
jgi:hypothetical protein